MVEAYEKTGGPPRLVRLLLQSPLRDKYDFHVLTYSISGLDLKALFMLHRQIVRLKPAVVHIHGLKCDGFIATVAARLACEPRLLVTIHGSTADGIKDYHTFNQKLRQWVVGQILEPITLRLADAVYCVCNAMKHNPRIRKHASGRLHDTIYNGVQINPVTRKTNSLRKDFGFADDDLVLLYVGRITRDKGLEVLAAAINAIVRVELRLSAVQRRKIKLLLVGDGQAFNEIRACFQPLIETNHVVMTGRRDDIDELNDMADLFVFPSLHENLPFSLLEAMNSSRAIVATAVGGNIEVVEDGRTGLLVPPGDAGALAHAILRLAADDQLRSAMGKAGQRRLATHFSADEVIRKTDALYELLLTEAKVAMKADTRSNHIANPSRPIPLES